MRNSFAPAHGPIAGSAWSICVANMIVSFVALTGECLALRTRKDMVFRSFRLFEPRVKPESGDFCDDALPLAHALVVICMLIFTSLGYIITRDTLKCRDFLAQLQVYVNYRGYHMNVLQPPGPALLLTACIGTTQHIKITVNLKTDMIIYRSLCDEVRRRIFIHVTKGNSSSNRLNFQNQLIPI